MTWYKWVFFILFYPVLISGQDRISVIPDSINIEPRSFDSLRMADYRADPEFNYEKQVVEQAPWKVWWHNFKKRLNRILFGAGPLRSLWIILLVAGAILAVVYFFMNTRARGMLARRSARLGGTVSVFEEDIDAQSLDKGIQESLASGDYRLAFRWLYIKLLTELDQAGEIRLTSYKTNRDYRREMRDHPRREVFREISRAFEYFWYGDHSPGENEFASWREVVDQLTPKINSG